MAFPSGIAALAKVFQTTDGAQVEPYTVPAVGPYTHQLGSNLAPSGYASYPAGWALVPDGAFHISAPAAFSASSATAATGNLLGGIYKYALTEVTDYGETLPGPTLTTATVTAGSSYTLTLPAVGGTAINPVRKRRLYRSTVGGSTLYLLAEIADLAQLTYTDTRNDTGLSASGAATPPASDTSGWNPPGNAGPIAVRIGSPLVAATEVAASPSAGQYVVDYAAGVVTHAAADAGKPAQATITAATLVNAAMLNAVITSLKEVQTAAGAALGLATLDGSGRLVQAVSGTGAPGGLATLDGSTHVVQHSAWEGLASGVPTLDGSAHVVQHSALEGVASGIPTLNASSLVVQDPASKGLASGVCPLDASAKVPSANLPAGAATTQTGVSYDGTESAAVGGSTSLLDNMNHLRFQLGSIFAGAWNAAVAMIPRSWLGVASSGAVTGVATLDTAAHVPLAQISGLTNSQLSGSAAISDANIQGMSASKLVGSIPPSSISGLTNTNLSGSAGIVDANIASMATSKLSGQVTDGQIQNVSASKLLGQVTAAQIGAVNPSSLTGSGTVPLAGLAGITNTQLSGAANIQAGQIQAVNPSTLTGTGTVPVAGLPTATASTLGVVKPGTGMGIVAGALGLLGSHNVAQLVAFQNNTELNVDTSHQTLPSTIYSNWGHLTDVSITTSGGSSILAIVFGFPWNYLNVSGNWCRTAVALDGANVQPTSGQINQPANGPNTFPSGVAGFGVWSGVAAGTHLVNILMGAGGSGGVTSAGYKVYASGSTDSYLNVMLLEFF